MKDMLHQVIKDSKDWRHLQVTESRDGETDQIPEMMITYGYGVDHGHISLTLDEVKMLNEFTGKILKKFTKD